MTPEHTGGMLALRRANTYLIMKRTVNYSSKYHTTILIMSRKKVLSIYCTSNQSRAVFKLTVSTLLGQGYHQLLSCVLMFKRKQFSEHLKDVYKYEVLWGQHTSTARAELDA